MSDTTGQLPAWMPALNGFVRTINKVGLRMGPVHVLTVPGRKTGAPRTTPVTPIEVEGVRYVVAGLPQGDWARNVRAAGRATLGAGRRQQGVTLTEVDDPAVCETVMRAFPVQARGGVPFMVKLGLVTGPNPDEFARAASRVAVFRITPN